MLAYLILEDDGMYGLQRKVNEYIEKGYKPQGGIFVRDIGMSAYYLQGMIKGE